MAKSLVRKMTEEGPWMLFWLVLETYFGFAFVFCSASFGY
jgi:hypothetical protein